MTELEPNYDPNHVELVACMRERAAIAESDAERGAAKQSAEMKARPPLARGARPARPARATAQTGGPRPAAAHAVRARLGRASST